jgi:hypothetical protein
MYVCMYICMHSHAVIRNVNVGDDERVGEVDEVLDAYMGETGHGEASSPLASM